MNYIIQTPSATRLKKEIQDCVEEKVDANGIGIATWQIVETDKGDRVLVHTDDQWAEKGCITLRPDLIRGEVQVRFFYWDSCADEDRGNCDDKYMLGRFTELLLVHFKYLIDKVVIE